MKTPDNLKYTKSHEWVAFLEADKIRVGITDFAQEALGNIVFVNLPEVEDEVAAGDSFADVESVKAVSDINAPAAGVISEINEEVMEAPELLNEEPYDAWLVEISGISEVEELLDAQAYEAYCREEE